MKKIFLKISELLAEKKNIAVICHINPDGDAIGSLLALSGILKKMGHQVSAISPNEFPAFLSWLPGADNILVFSKQKSAVEAVLIKAELIFFVDFNALKRIEKLGKYIPASAKKIMIDHHLEPENFCDIVVSEIQVSSTAELVYKLIHGIKADHLIDSDIAEAFYVGIMTDTGSFSFSLYEDTFAIASKLLAKGIDPVRINKKVYDTFSENRLRLLGHCLVNKLEVFPEAHASLIWLSKKELDYYKYQTGDTEGIVNYGLSMEGIMLTAFIMERDNHVKISLRSKGEVDVNRIAREYFNGGGHLNAAGGQLNQPLSEVIAIFKNLIKKERHDLHALSLKFEKD